MDSKKRLSVVIPGFNNPEGYWRRCLKSVLANLGSEDEVVCIDDGSSEKPLFLDDIACSDDRVQVVYLERNVGLPSARNAALDRVRGEFVTFVDSDDEVCEGIYEKAIPRLIETASDIVIFGVRSIWVSERLYKVNCPPSADYGVINPADVKWLFDNSLLNYAWNKVYRRQFLVENDLRFDRDGVPCEDIIFVLDCLSAKARWSSLPDEGIRYYRTHGSLLSRYKATGQKGLRLSVEAWHRYKDSDPCAAEVLCGIGELSDRQLVKMEWDNIWRKGSPYGFLMKIRFAATHKEIGRGHPILVSLKKLFFSVLRRWLYVVPVQRWHIRKTYPDVKDCR